MMIRTCLVLSLFFVLFQAKSPAQVGNSGSGTTIAYPRYELPDATPFAATITVEDLKFLVDTLASDAMEGRETGEAGQRMAADFIASQFRDAGLPGVADRRGYFQKIFLQRTTWKDIALKVGKTEYSNRKDFYVFHAFNPDNPQIQLKEVVFVGYGIEDGKHSDYQNMDVRGKAVLFYNGEPLDKDGRSVLTGSIHRSQWSLDWKRKVELAREKGAQMAFIVDTDFEENLKKNRRQISTYGWSTSGSDGGDKSASFINSVFIRPEVAEAILGKKAAKAEDAVEALQQGGAFKPVKVKSAIEVRLDKEIATMEGSNVVGFIEGSDPYLKNQYVIITAHYDHLGKVEDLVYNGADDNASGTSGVIAIARAFAEAKKKGVGPKRSVVCMLVSGEEKGLLGSRFYVDFPLFPLKNTVANINIDMIGRVDKAHADNPDYIYVIGADRLSSDLKEITEHANSTHTKLELDYKYDDPKDPNRYYERSDHYNFVRNNIPAVFFFNGTHEDYHKATDTRDKINFDALAKRAQLAFYTAWDVANRPARLGLDKEPSKEGLERGDN
jgi:hypothetical protein